MTASRLDFFLFDLGNVLIDFDFKVAVKKLGVHGLMNPLKIYNLFRDAELTNRWDKGLLSSEDFYAIIQKELELPHKLEEFIPIWNDIFTENRRMVQLALNLAEAHQVMILSNTNPWHVDHIRAAYPWVGQLHGFIASCDVRLMKPDLKIYQLALERANVAPERALYVDDLLENVEGARRAGMDAVLFQGYEALVDELRKRNVPSSLFPA